MPEEDKEIKEKKKEPGWWTTLDIKVKLGVIGVVVLLFYIYFLQGQNLQNAFVIGGLLLLVVFALSSKYEPEKDVLSPEEATKMAMEEALKIKERYEIYRDCRIYFNGKCSDLIQISGIPTSYYIGFNFHFPDGQIDYMRAIVKAMPPNIGGTAFQQLDYEFNGIDDVMPHKEFIFPGRLMAAKKAGIDWIFK